ncbi:MAG: acyloxyacyl hydrolase [Xanthomonadales bacterium]|nr:acyloxyacyl hydrolase [Xanthomonadales bacterium]
MPKRPIPGQARCRVARLLGAVLLLGASHASAWQLELGAGPVDEIDGVRSRSAALLLLSEGRHPWELSAGWIAPRRARALRTPSTRFLAVGRRFSHGRFFLSSGIAVVDRRSEALSSHHQFMTGLGWRLGRLTIGIRHLSNANTAGRNRGENLLWIALPAALSRLRGRRLSSA